MKFFRYPCFFPEVDNFQLWFLLEFPIEIPWRTISRNCAQLFSNCAEFRGVYRARNCAQVKSTCVGNPSFSTKMTRRFIAQKQKFNLRNSSIFKITQFLRRPSFHGNVVNRYATLEIKSAVPLKNIFLEMQKRNKK